LSFAGEQFCFDTVLTNIANGDPGFSPYYRLILPPNISLDSVTFLESGISSSLVGVFAAPGNELTDPIIDAPISGTTGDSFYTISLPVGSVVTGGPDLTINFCMTIDSAAAIGSPLDIIYQPVYALGDTATGDNGPIIGAAVTDQVTPTLIVFDKQYNGPESERTPGPSFPFTFSLIADVANGKIVENLIFNDTLPTDLQFVGPITITGGTGCSVTTSPSLVTPGGFLSVSCTSITGTTADQDVTVIIPAYVIDTLDETNCTTELKTNTSTLDFEFPAGNSFPQLSAQDQLTAKHLAIQKSASPGSPSTASPGQTVTYTNSIQLSDYAIEADHLVITDLLPDGTTFAAHTSLVIGNATVPIVPTVTHNANGTTTVIYDIHAVTGNILEGATATLTYTATIDQAYESPISPVLAADSLTNNITADYSLTSNANNCSDTSSATVLIEPTEISKIIVNQQAEYMPGDVVSYRLEMDIPSGDTSNIVFEDFFPLPVFDVNSLSLTFGDDVIHSPGVHTLPALIPVITRDSPTNSLTLTWPDVSTTMPQTLAVDIEITVEDEPFADDLSLTNLFVASSKNTINTQASEVKPVQFKIRAPSVTLTKGIAATTNGDSTLSPAPGSPVDSDLDDADAGDAVTFVMTAENTGGAPAFQLAITDPAVTGLTNCSLVSVTDGTNALTYTPAAATSLASGIELNNPVPANGRVLATVTCDIDTAVSPQQIITNTASASWRSQSASTAFPAVTDDAIITIAQPTTEKTIELVTPGLQYPSQVTAGDVITYRLQVTLPEGNTDSLVLTDTLPAGFIYQSAVIDSAGFNGTASIASANAVGQTVTITMTASTTTTADNDASNNSFSVLVTALVDGTEAANSGINAAQQKTNELTLDYTGRTGTISSSVSTEFVEPSLTLVKTMSPDRNIEADDTITITLAVTNNGTSPAYDVVVTDILNDVDNLFDLATVNPGTTPAGYTYSLVGGNTVTYTGDNSVPIASGDTVTFTFTAQVRPDIESGSSFNNTASVTGDSQPGVVPDERTTTDTGTDTVSTRKVRNKKIIISSSEAWTSDDPGNTQASIGEILRYRVVIRVPEGTTTANGSLITDRLPVDFEYQLGTATIRGVYDTSLTEGGTPIPIVATAIAPDISGRNMSFNLGDLQNNDNDPNIEQIIVEYDVLVLNTASNNAGDKKTNRFRLNFLNADGNAQSSTAKRTITLVEPQLSITKQALPSSVQGGTQTQFTVVLSNQNIANSTRAWEPVITDQLPVDFINLQIVSATLSRGAVDISGCASFAGNLLSVDSSCLAVAERYLDPGETYTVVYTADVTPTVLFEQQITNTASGTASSLPGDNGTGSVTPGNPGDNDGERTGSGAGTNDLQTSAQATVIADKPTITKSGDALLQIGETTTMTLMIGVPVGTTNNFVLTDDLPTGLSFAGNYSLSIPAGINSTITPGAPAIGTDPVVLNFDSITNSTAQPLNITIKYDVVVDNILANQDTTQLTNTVSLNYQNADQANLPTDTATITVIEANLEITKSITSGAANAEAGDTVSYQLIVSNTGTFATAYQVDFTDILPAGLLGAPDGTGSAGVNFTQIIVDNDSGAIVNNGGGALTDADIIFSTTNNPDDTLGFPLFDIPAGKTLTITYSAVVANTVGAGDTISNNTLATYDSLEAGGGRNADDNSDDDSAGVLDNYQESDIATVEISNDIAIQKTLNSSHSNNDFTIGDLITYDLQVDVIEGITTAVVVTDSLPAGLELEGPVRIIAGPNISYSGSGVAVEAPANTLTITMGTVTNTADANASNDQFTIEIDARVKDIPANMDGDSLTNSTSVTSDAGSAGPDTVNIDIVEPNLQVSKTPDSATITLGDIVTFTINVDHVNSHADAFDVSLDDLIPVGMTYVPGSHQGDGVVDESDPAQPVFDLGAITLVDMGKQFSFQASIDNDATISLPITNTIDVAYSSQAGAPTDDRTYTDSGSGVVTPVISNALDAMKTVALVVDAGTAGQVDPGDTLEYTVTLTNTLDPLNNVVFTDTMPTNTSYVAASLTTNAGTTDESAAPDLLVDVGDMATNAVVTITFRVTVDAGTPTGTVISNQGSVDSDQTTPEPTDEDGVDGNGDQPTDIPVGPVATINNPLYVQKIVNWLDDVDASSDITAGDTLRYTLIIENNGNQALTNISVTDTIPAGLTFIGGSDSVTGAGTINVAGSAVTITIPSIPAGDFEIAEFDVTVDAFAPTSASFVNQADTDSDQTTPGLSDSNGDSSDGNQPTTISAVNGIPGTPILDVEKRWSLSVDVDGDGLVDPGDELTYVITTLNTGSAPATDVRFNDSIPVDTTVVSGSVFTSIGLVVTEDPVSVNIGILDPGQLVSVNFMVTVDAGTADGTIIPNQATVTATGGISEPSDDNGNDADGKNPTLTPVDTGAGSGGPSGLSKSLQSTSEAGSTGTTVLIGEVLTYQVTFNLPVGTLEEVTISDTLPVGLSYVAGTARLQRVFDTGLSSSVNPGSINTAGSATFISLTDGSDLLVTGNQIDVFLGDLINSDNDANTESYTLEVKVVVENIAANQAGGSLDNSARISYLNALSQLQMLSPVNTSVDMIEPNIQISKSASPTTLLETGGNVTFTLQVTNADTGSTATAYNVNINDTLSADWTAITVDSITQIGGVSGITDNSAFPSVDIDVSTFPVGGTLTVTVTATSANLLNAGQLTNTANSTSTSLPGTQGTGNATPGNSGDTDGERTGSGSNANDYSDQDNAVIQVGNPAIVKTILNPKTRYAIGDEVEYQLQVSIPASTRFANTVIEDVLDEGLMYVAGSFSSSVDAGLSAALTPVDFTRTDNAPAAGQETVSASFGTLNNNGLPAAARTITITYRATVENRLGNQNNQTLDNTAAFKFDNPGTGNTTSTTNAKSVTVGEPALAITKAITSNTANLDAGDQVDFTVVVENTGTTTAFETVLGDSLPTGLVTITNLQVTAITGGTPTPTLANNVTSWTSAAFDIPVSGTITISFSAQLSNTVLPGQAIQNSARAAFSSVDGTSANERDGSDAGSEQTDGNLDNYNATGSAPSIIVADPVQLDKQFHSDPALTTYTIGDTIGYRLTLNLLEGQLNNVIVTDTLPDNVRFESAVVGVGNIGISHQFAAVSESGQQLTFDFGTVNNPANSNLTDDSITIDITVTLLDSVSNVDGATLGNNATISFTGANGSVTRDYDNDAGTAGIQPLDLTVVEPLVEMTKSVNQASVPQGDIVTFTVLLDHAVASTADAFDLQVIDTLPAGLSYIANSASIPVIELGQQLTFDIAALTLLDDQTSFSYQASVDLNVTTGTTLTNNAGVVYSTQPGVNADERSYSDTDNADVVVETTSFIEASKTVVIINDAGTVEQLDIGDTLEYTVILENQENAVSNAVFTDNLPINTTYVANSLSSTAGVTDDSAAPDLVVNLGNMLANDLVTITFQVTINAGTANGTVISNQGSVDSDQTTPEPTDVDGIDGNGDQPTDIPVGGLAPIANALHVQKLVDWIDDADASNSITAGDTVRYRFIVRNLGNQSLTNVFVTDTIPAGLSVVANSETISGLGNTVAVAGANLLAAIPLLNPAASETISVDVTIDSPLLDTDADLTLEQFINQAQIGSDQTPNAQSDNNADPADGTQPTTFTAVDGIPGTPDLDLQKRWSLFNDANGNGSADELDVIQYTITMTNNGAGIANNVFVDDTIPANTSIVPSSIASSQGIVINEAPVSVNVGNVNPAAQITITFQVKVDAGTPGGTIISNQAFADADNTPVIPSDDNGDPSDGLNPVLTPVTDTNTSANPAIMKSLISSDQADSVDPQLVIGEIATFQITFNFPAGQLSEISLLDILPAGMTYVPGSSQLARVFDTGITASSNPAAINSTASAQFVSLNDSTEILINGQQLSVFLGEVIVSDADNQASYQLRYQTQVNNIASNQAATSLNNAASLNFLDGLNQPQTLTPVQNTVSVIEPDVQILKTANPPLVLTTGGLVEFTVVVSNPRSGVAADAFDVNISDSLSTDWSQLNVISLTPSSPAVLGIVDNSAGTILDISIDHLPIDETLTIVYSAQAASGLAVASISNTANSDWSSLPGTSNGERDGDGNGANDYVASSTANVNIGDTALQKSVINPQGRYAVGDVIDYQLVFALPPAAILNNVVLSDVLDAGLELVPNSLQVINNPSLSISATIADFIRSDNTPVAGMETLTLNLDTVENTANVVDVVTIQYQVTVENLLNNQDNVKLNNDATISFTNPGDPNLLISQNDSTEVTVGEPHLVLTKTLLSSASGVDAGDLIEYQVVIANDGSSPAFNTVLTDVLPAGLLLNGTPVITANSGNFTLPVINTAGNQWTTNPFQLPVAASMTLTIPAQIDTSVLPSDTIQNSVGATFSSHASNGRNGDDPNADQDDDLILDNYAVTDAAQTIVINDPIAINKSFAPDAGQTTYTIGEHLTYRLKIDLLEGSVNNVQVFDTLPAGTRFIASTVAVGNTGISLQLPGTAVENGQILSFNFGNISNPANGNNSDDHVVIDIEVVIEDIGANQDSFVLDNNASVHFDGANGPEIRDFDNDSNAPGNQPLSLTLVEPELNITKSVNPDVTPPGQVVRFTLVIDHTVNSTADAFDLDIVDTLPAGMSFVTGSASQAVQVNGQQLTFTVAVLTLLDGQTTISYDVMIANNAVLQQVLTNQAQITYSSQTGSNPDERFYNDADSADVIPDSSTILDALKTVSVIDDGTITGQLNPGDIVEYTVVISNQGATANQLLFTDNLPDQLSYVAGTMTSSLGVANDSLAPQLSVTLASIANGQSFIVTYQAQIVADVSDGTIISNQGIVDSNETLPEPTDSDGIDGNGDQPTSIVVGTSDTTSTMSVNKTFRLSNDLVAPVNTINNGDEVTYDIVIRNTGNTELTNLSFSDVVPSGTQPTGMQVTLITTTQGTAPAVSNTIQISDIGTLAAGQSVTISMTGIVTGTGVLSNQATVSSTETGDQLSDANTNTDDGEQPTTFPISDAGVSGQPQLALNKAVVLLIDSNADQQVNPGEVVRFTIIAANTGNATAIAVHITDLLSGLNADLIAGSVISSQGNILSESPELAIDTGNLLPGGQLTVTFDMVARDPGLLSNTATVTDQQGNSATADATINVIVFEPFDPPHGTKTINSDGLPELEWTMVWINPNTIYTMPLRVVDPIPANATYVANSVMCVAQGISSIIDCSFDSANNQIVMNGLIGADGNALDAATANNEIIITLRTRVEDLALEVVNQGQGLWDEDGDGSVDNDIPNQIPALTDEPVISGIADPTVWTPVVQPPTPGSIKPIPTLAEWSRLLLMMLILLISISQIRNKKKTPM
jgi:uncharacterized repeat protein (TIGR01451 family)/fimbrial isopeptide formation D2 family protein